MRAVIFANGRVENHTQVISQLRPNDVLIAADGGAEHCKDIGIQPHIVVGDMDSISPLLKEELESAGTTFVTFPEDKNQTDLELALSLAAEKGYREVLLLGMFGGRLDQSLANILLLTRDEWQDLRLIISAEPDTAYLMRDQDEISLLGQPGDIVSLIPLSSLVEDVSTQGLRWSLDHADLNLGNTLSVSNEMLDTAAHVQVGAGILLLIHRDATVLDEEE